MIHFRCPFFLLRKLSFSQSEIDDLKIALSVGSDNILLLHTKAKTINVGGFILGAKGSKHSRSSLVLARKTRNGVSSTNIAEVQYFASCTIVSAGNGHKQTVWVASVHWYMEHQCRVWFGQPTQVWSGVCYPGNFLILISNNVSRVVYAHHLVSFGWVIGEEKVYIIVPFFFFGTI